MKIHIIMHESFESPAAIEKWAIKKNHIITYSRTYNFESLPQNADNFDFLVVMGGPQDPSTTKEECPHFDAQAEISLIKNAITQKKAILGVCLGAQLIGEAFGANFEHSPNREIGVFDITLTQDGKKDAFFSTLPPVFPVGHWHGDMPGLTKESKILATSKGCPRQIVKYGEKIYGFQCHFEFTRESIEGMIKSCSHELEAYKNLPYIQNIEILRNHNYDSFNQYLFQFLDSIENTINN